MQTLGRKRMSSTASSTASSSTSKRSAARQSKSASKALARAAEAAADEVTKFFQDFLATRPPRTSIKAVGAQLGEPESRGKLSQILATLSSTFSAASAIEETKPVSDENAPKKPKSAYLYFCDAHRANYSALPPPERMRALGAAWKALDPEVNPEADPAARAPFIALGEQDRARYLEEWAAYTPAEGTAQALRALKIERAALRPPTAYQLFCSDMRARVVAELPADSKTTLVMAKLGELWSGDYKEAAKRAPWIARAEAEKARLASVSAASAVDVEAAAAPVPKAAAPKAAAPKAVAAAPKAAAPAAPKAAAPKAAAPKAAAAAAVTAAPKAAAAVTAAPKAAAVTVKGGRRVTAPLMPSTIIADVDGQ